MLSDDVTPSFPIKGIVNFQKKVCFSRRGRLKVTYMFMALTNSLVVLFIAVLLQIF